MPFGTSLQLDMEMWSWTDCDMGYGVGAYWYGDADTTSNRTPDPKGVLRIPPLPVMGQEESGSKPGSVQGGGFDNVVECETMKVVAKSDGLKAAPQNLTRVKGTWSASGQILVRGRQVGDFVELRVPSQGPGAR